MGLEGLIGYSWKSRLDHTGGKRKVQSILTKGRAMKDNVPASQALRMPFFPHILSVTEIAELSSQHDRNNLGIHPQIRSTS